MTKLKNHPCNRCGHETPGYCDHCTYVIQHLPPPDLMTTVARYQEVLGYRVRQETIPVAVVQARLEALLDLKFSLRTNIPGILRERMIGWQKEKEVKFALIGLPPEDKEDVWEAMAQRAKSAYP